MAIFKYKAEAGDGRIKRGQIVGLSESEALAKLRKKELAPIAIADITNSQEMRLKRLISSIKSKDLVIFSRQFSVMIAANVPVVESLIILIDQTQNITLKNMIAEIAFEVDGGSFLSDAFAKRPKVFSNFFVNIVRSGETSGKLDEVLTYLADEMEKNYDMVAKIRGAMIYPIFVTVFLIGVAVLFMVYIMPNLTTMLTETNVRLPLATRIIIGASNFMKGYLWLIILLLGGAAFLVRLFLKTYNGRRALDKAKLSLPIFGKLFQNIYIMRFTRSLATLLKGGVTITRSLEITAEVVGNVIYRELILDTLESINDGNPLSQVMESSPYVPQMVPQMISVGEKTGRLDNVLDQATGFYVRETSNMLDNLSKLIEPIIMVIMGIGVFIMVAAVLLPMYNLATQF